MIYYEVHFEFNVYAVYKTDYDTFYTRVKEFKTEAAAHRWIAKRK